MIRLVGTGPESVDVLSVAIDLYAQVVDLTLQVGVAGAGIGLLHGKTLGATAGSDKRTARPAPVRKVDGAPHRSPANVPAIVLRRQEVRPVNALSVMGAPLPYTIGRLS